MGESLPLLLVKLGLCSELDVADAFVEVGAFRENPVRRLSAGGAAAGQRVAAVFEKLPCNRDRQ